MPIQLKSQKSAVVDALRSARNADDELSRLKENSWEKQRTDLVRLVEGANWRYGPAELLATFPHHAVAKAPNGNLVQVEWSRGKDGSVSLGRAVIHETVTPVADLGQELMETARSAVDTILSGNLEAAQPMITTIAEALDSGGDLSRRIDTEVTLRSLTRNAWWHQVVGIREGLEDKIPAPTTEGEDFVSRSINDLLLFLKESATEASDAMRALSNSDSEGDIESLARDIAEDASRAISALVAADTSKQEEALKVYEAVISTTPRLLNGIEFLKDLVDEDDCANSQEQ